MSPRAFVVIGVAVLVLVAGLAIPASAVSGGDLHDLTVSSRTQWHATFRYWEINAPEVIDDKSSPLISPGAWFTNALFFGKSEPKDARFTLEQNGQVIHEVHQKTAEGSRIGNEDFLKVVFRKVEPGTYEMRAQILNPDGGILDEATNTYTVRGS